MSLTDQIDKNNVPKHVAIIMDGNGRWAKKKHKPRIFGHRNALKAVREVTEGCAEIGVENLTLYAFSTENWNRPKLEVMALMELLVKAISEEVKTLNKNNIRLHAIGNLDGLPAKCQIELNKAIENTNGNKRMNLILALNYSAKWEIVEAVKAISRSTKSGEINEEDIDEDLFSEHLSTKNFPDPELMIRTSGESRISNFLLWQLSYAELFFTEVLWPDFRKEHLHDAIVSYQSRERRFGMTSEQLSE